MLALSRRLYLVMAASVLILLMGFIAVIGLTITSRSEEAVKAQLETDLQSASKIIDLLLPGSWRTEGGSLYKGSVLITHNNEAANNVAEITGTTCSILAGDVIVSTTIRDNQGNLAVGTKASNLIYSEVINNGRQFAGRDNIGGQEYQAIYRPLMDQNGSIIGMLTVGYGKSSYTGILIDIMIKTAIMALVISLLVLLLFRYMITRQLKPWQEIAQGTDSCCLGGKAKEVEGLTDREINDSIISFCQVVERLEDIAAQIKTASSQLENHNGSKSLTDKASCHEEEKSSEDKQKYLCRVTENLINAELPKGLNKATLQQVISFLDIDSFPISAEEVAEKVSISRVTVRRYLEFLEEKGIVMSKFKYGTVGRPVKLYDINIPVCLGE